MRELLRSNDPVLLSYVEALLRDAGFEPLLADQNMSVLEGSVGVLPRRVLVKADNCTQARRVLADAGLAHWLIAQDCP